MAHDSQHEAANVRKWDARADSFDQVRFDYFRWMQKRALSLVNPAPGLHFLDLGCGTGFAVRWIANALRYDGMFQGIDISPRMIQIAQSHSAGLSNVHFQVATAEALPFDSAVFDAIVCTNSFHHYLHPQAVLTEIRRVLKQAGRVCILDVTADNFIVRRIDERTSRNEPEHVKFYSTAEYREMFKQVGLRPIMVKPILPPIKVHVAEK